jgi:4-hydroxy-tetrahydrodipicolinate reductase
MNASSTSSGPALRVILSGVTGWAGSALAHGILGQNDLRLVAGIARSAAGSTIGQALNTEADGAASAPVHATAAAACALPAEVFFEYSKPEVAKANVITALKAGLDVVVGTSGLTDEDYAEIDTLARSLGRGVLACGNFAITAVLLLKFAEMAARYLPDVEVLDYAKASKVDVPSGTVRELVVRLGAARGTAQPGAVPLDQVRGPKESRGAPMSGIPVHALRVPGYALSVEAVFGAPDQRLQIRHDSGSSAEPYVDGALLAIRAVRGRIGLTRGLDRVMDV